MFPLTLSPRRSAQHSLLRCGLLPQEAAGTLLQQREVSSAEHCLGLLQRIDLPGASLLPNIEILQQPVALSMQRRNVFHGSHQLLASIGLRCRVIPECSLCIRLGRPLLSQRLRVCGPLCRRIFHHRLIIGLTIFFVSLCLSGLWSALPPNLSSSSHNRPDHLFRQSLPQWS